MARAGRPRTSRRAAGATWAGATWAGATGMRWLKFNLVGAVGIGVQLATLAALRALGVDYLWATALAVEVAVVHNFVWHQRFTWADRRSVGAGQWLRRGLRFNLTTGAVSIGGNLLLMRLLVGQGHLPVLVANLMTVAACSLVNFLVSDGVVFRPTWVGVGRRPRAFPF